MTTNDQQLEVFLVWDHTRREHGEHAELMGVFASVDAAIEYAIRTFEDDEWDYVRIENWLTGMDHEQASYTLAENQDAAR